MKLAITIAAMLAAATNSASAQQITHVNTWGDFTVALTSSPCPDSRWNDTGYKLAYFKDANGHRAMGCWTQSYQRRSIRYFWIEKDDPRMRMPPELPVHAFQRVVP